MCRWRLQRNQKEQEEPQTFIFIFTSQSTPCTFWLFEADCHCDWPSCSFRCLPGRSLLSSLGVRRSACRVGLGGRLGHSAQPYQHPSQTRLRTSQSRQRPGSGQGTRQCHWLALVSFSSPAASHVSVQRQRQGHQQGVAHPGWRQWGRREARNQRDDHLWPTVRWVWSRRMSADSDWYVGMDGWMYTSAVRQLKKYLINCWIYNSCNLSQFILKINILTFWISNQLNTVRRVNYKKLSMWLQRLNL